MVQRRASWYTVFSMDDRKRLRNQFILPAWFAVMWAAKMFYAPPPFALGQYMQAGAVALFLWLAGTKYLEYREKYRASPLAAVSSSARRTGHRSRSESPRAQP